MNIKDFILPSRCLALTLVAGILTSTLVSAASAAPEAPAKSTADSPQNPFGPKPPPGTEPVPTPTPSSVPGASAAPAGEKWVTAVRELLLERFDKNHDGTFDATEVANAQAVLSNTTPNRGRTPGQARGGVTGPLFGLRALIIQRFDKNGDGMLDATELADFRQVLFPGNPSPPDALEALRQDIIQQFDKKGNGKLDASEIAAAKAFLQQMLADLDKPLTGAGAPANGTAMVIPRPIRALAPSPK